MRLLLRPDSASYSVQFAEEAVRVQLEGGRGRYRSDVLNGSDRVTAQWTLDRNEYDYFMAFYRSIANHGATTFQLELIVDDFDLGERDVNFIPGTVSLTGQQGLSYTVQAELEVHAVVNPTQETDDTAIVDAYNASQGYVP